MINKDIIEYLDLQRQIFGTCPNSGSIFRLSDCRIYTKKPEYDWLQKIENKQYQIDLAQEKLNRKEEKLRDAAHEAGRKEANKVVRKIDKVFNPLKLNPDDAKVIFHPIDYIVFNGMKAGKLKNVLLIDKKDRSGVDKQLQKSIERAVEREKYEWITLRVSEGGVITEE
ncbi:MAG: Holliday junction resolvase-like protein [Candidatus Paceibacterota bacterium]|jgi:predicted Holliday junction resolvase-like endonuclease